MTSADLRCHFRPVKLHVQRRLRCELCAGSKYIACGFYLTMLLTFAFLFTLIEASAMPSEVSPALPAGCYKPLPQGQFAGGVSTIHVTSDGERRTFLLSIPPEYHSDTPAAAVLSYHGGGRNAEDQLKLDQLTNPEFNSAAFVIYPQGIDETWQGVPGATSDDILFTSDILDYVQYRYCIDPTRISATGRTCPSLSFHGGKDKVISYKGGSRKKECLPSIPHFIQQWASLDGLGIDNTTTRVSQNTVLYTFGHGSKAGLVEHVYDSAIGHDWPILIFVTQEQVTAASS
ncbi:hypothetical protein J3458_021781 [Metarhizium acridum]|uniref:uncharacterized protein n=1 Tax=Metarhizium acridum TaxID=92637 RepID=UPI001C6C24C9|nr:hypothetical protein J3458_021781 [Metarhizium acridum]